MDTNIIELLTYDFFQNALYASVLTGITCGIIGTYIVAKRIVFISGGITHSSFGGLGIAYYAGISPMLGATVFALLSALGTQYFAENKKIREDSLIGIFWSAGMAIGILFIFMTPGYAPNLMSYLFGDILTIDNTQLILMAALAIITILFFYLFYRTVFYIAFDPEYARTHHIPVSLFNGLLISLVALTIVMSINVAGIILVIAYLTIPQNIAALFFNDFKTMLIASAVICPLGSIAGLLISAMINIPSGAAVIITLVAIYLIALGYSKLIKPRIKQNHKMHTSF